MQPLEQLVRDAQRLAGAEPVAITGSTTGDEAEVARVLQICNACRYCEGFCAVFPAMTRRLAFPKADLHYLANLCHNCGACLHACQYAPPHEFAVNVPRAMARVRGQTYADHAWPRRWGRLYARNGLTLSLALTLSLGVFLLLAAAQNGSVWRTPSANGFYDIFPHGLMVSMFGPVLAFALVALGMGVSRFWRDVAPGAASRGAAIEAASNVLTLKYLDGGHGQGCAESDDASTLARRRMHHLTFYGFALCFSSTSVATIYHYALGWPAPYGWASLPKLLGVSGGIALVTGTLGLAWLRTRRHAQHREPSHRPMDLGFIALLCLTGASGLALAAARATPLVPLLLCLHLASVMALFLTMPYGKFAHGAYRAAALLKWSIERRQPNRLTLGGD